MWISSSKLQEGMVVDRDIRMNDIVLVRADTPLSVAHIRSLKRWNVSRVSVMEQPSEAINEGGDDGSDVLAQKMCRINQLFSKVGDDADMMMIKECLVNHLEDKHRDV